jgi:hypothetical protein
VKRGEHLDDAWVIAPAGQAKHYFVRYRSDNAVEEVPITSIHIAFFFQGLRVPLAGLPPRVRTMLTTLPGPMFDSITGEGLSIERSEEIRAELDLPSAPLPEGTSMSIDNSLGWADRMLERRRDEGKDNSIYRQPLVGTDQDFINSEQGGKVTHSVISRSCEDRRPKKPPAGIKCRADRTVETMSDCHAKASSRGSARPPTQGDGAGAPPTSNRGYRDHLAELAFLARERGLVVEVLRRHPLRAAIHVQGWGDDGVVSQVLVEGKEAESFHDSEQACAVQALGMLRRMRPAPGLRSDGTIDYASKLRHIAREQGVGLEYVEVGADNRVDLVVRMKSRSPDELDYGEGDEKVKFVGRAEATLEQSRQGCAKGALLHMLVGTPGDFRLEIPAPEDAATPPGAPSSNPVGELCELIAKTGKGRERVSIGSIAHGGGSQASTILIDLTNIFPNSRLLRLTGGVEATRKLALRNTWRGGQ